MSRTTHPAFHPKYAHAAYARPADWRDWAYHLADETLDNDDDEIDGLDALAAEPRFFFTLFGPPYPPPPLLHWELLFRRIDFDRCWPWVGDEALHTFRRELRDDLLAEFLERPDRTALPVWLQGYVYEGLASIELDQATGRPTRLWACRTRLGVAVATDADLVHEIIPQLRTHRWG